jgi:fibronectin type 3 domain-containing protein
MKRIKVCQFLTFLATIFLCLTMAQAGAVKLAWDASEGATGYKIYTGTSTRNYPTIKDVGNILTYTTPDLPAGSTYFFAATAYDAGKMESDYSDEVSYVMIAYSPITGVKLGTMINTTPAGVVLGWTNIANVSGYKIKYGTVSGTYTTVIDAKASNPYLITGLKNNTTYYLIVTGYDAAGKEVSTSLQFGFKTFTVTGLTVR